ncbi:hypothetical protein J2847_005090 [Azospirillum agricola]|uniref:hypothetical protein n=1 Tax=Azospirillum agricola TaxID=1720247 RepID=UPI001AE764F8|nr:hypothetical protein [Azospirillum agricola]MBP2231771.1 hypothetical protein [Azospirillum agricola]
MKRAIDTIVHDQADGPVPVTPTPDIPSPDPAPATVDAPIGVETAETPPDPPVEPASTTKRRRATGGEE